jgi:hypothetical protein
MQAKEYLLLMMERDDIAVVTGGFCRGLEGNGCEDILKKDFNVCVDCHSDSRHQFFVMCDEDDSVDSSLNHTGA